MLVVNSVASSVTARNTVIVHRRLALRHQVDVVETNRRGHATRFAHDAARRGYDLVIGFGGDGTLNEVTTGIAGTDTALGVLPGGSTNVFARTLGLPNDPLAAVDHLIAGMEADDVRPIGLGEVNGRSFCFHTGIGFDAAVVAAVERRASLKRWLGHPLFIGAAVTTWWRHYDRGHPHFSVSAPGHTTTDDGYFSIVLNTNPYTYVGNRPLDLTPDAALDRQFVVITFRTLQLGHLLRHLAAAIRGDDITPDEHLIVWNDVDKVSISHHTPFPYQVDGDYLGDVDRLELTHVPDAVRLLVPRPPADSPA